MFSILLAGLRADAGVPRPITSPAGEITMKDRRPRRTFLKRAAATVAALPAAGLVASESGKGRAMYVCVTCGMQYAETDGPPQSCPVCEDERQYVGWDGQKWTTLAEMQGKFKNVIKEEEPGLHSILTQPQIRFRPPPF